MTTEMVDYDLLIPNNVGLADDPKLRRALEQWHPATSTGGCRWGLTASRWPTCGYAAISVEKEGWAKFDYVKMPEYRWGILLAPKVEGRTIPCGEHVGDPVWTEVRGPTGPCCGDSS